MALITPGQALSRLMPKRKAGQAAPSNVRLSYDRTIGEKELLYIINNETTGMSYLCPADDRFASIIGSWPSIDSLEELPESVSEWFSIYEDEIEWAQSNELYWEKSSSTDSTVILPKSNSPVSENSVDTQEYLIDDVPKYDQKSPYNGKLVYGDYLEKKKADHWLCTGCPATSSSQILAYLGKKGYYIGCMKINPYTYKEYYTDVYLPFLSNFDFDHMLTNYYNVTCSEEDKDAVANLMQYAATAERSYTSIEDGASGANASNQVFGLRTKFCVNAPSYSEETTSNHLKRGWDEMLDIIYQEIKDGYPVMLGGKNENDKGHVFVCKGYRNKIREVSNKDGSITKTVDIDLYIDWGYNSTTTVYNNTTNKTQIAYKDLNGWYSASLLGYFSDPKKYGYNHKRHISCIHPLHSKDNVDYILLLDLLRKIEGSLIDSSADEFRKYNFDYDDIITSSDAETLARFMVKDKDIRDKKNLKNIKLATLVDIRRSLNEITSKLSQLVG